jgi:DNA-binding response OmpR family regulator
MAGRTNLLIIVDDEPFRSRLLDLAGDLGIDVRSERAAVEAILAYRATWAPHAIVLDQLMPRSEYYAASRALRSAFGVPVLAVSSETLSTDHIPEPGVLLLSRTATLAEIRRLCTRTDGGACAHTIGPLVLDRMTGAATHNGMPLRLTPDEVSTLAILMEHEGSIVHRRTLVAAIGGIQRDLDPRIIDVHVVRLMVKLGTGAPVSILRSPDREGYVLRRVESAVDVERA